jgi:serine/threonine protein kinase
MSKIAIGLEHMHSLAIVHRDINPNNVLIDESLNLKIIDFNVSKAIEKKRQVEKSLKFKYSMLTPTGCLGFRAPETFEVDSSIGYR